MKLPYREGEWYDLPLGDGSFAPLCLVRTRHHVVDVAAFADASAAGPVAALRTSDRALVLHRWKRRREMRSVLDVAVENREWISSAHAERIVAARLRRLPFVDKALHVVAVRNGDPIAGSGLTWDTPLDESTLQRICRHAAAHRNLRVRVSGEAARQLSTLRDAPVNHVILAGPYHGEPLPNVTHLSIETSMKFDDALERFPNVRALRIAVRDAEVRANALPRGVRALDCGRARSVQLEGAPPLEALRLAAVAVAPDLESLPHSLRALSLEHLTVASLAPVARIQELAQLELDGLWQFDLPDVEPLLEMPELVRAKIDIGGRRKNVELYKRARWAYPWPFESVMEAAGNGNSFQHAK